MADNCMNTEVDSLLQKYQAIKRQQFTFIRALENARENARHRADVVKNIKMVREYHSQCVNATEKRIMGMFLNLVDSIKNFCSSFHAEIMDAAEVVVPQVKGNTEAVRRMLSDHYNISELRVRYPHDEVNHLSCQEAKWFYGGVVSVLPLALDKLKDLRAQIHKAKSKYAKSDIVSRQSARQRSQMSIPICHRPYSAASGPPMSAYRHNECNTGRTIATQTDRPGMGERAKTSVQLSRSKQMVDMSYKKASQLLQELSTQRKVERHVNGMVCEDCGHLLRAKGERWRPQRVWRGASANAVNHVAHRYCSCNKHSLSHSEHVYHASRA